MAKRGRENKIIIVFSLVFACLVSHGYAGDHYNQGKSFYDSGKFEQAIEEFNKAIDLNPKDAIAYYHRGNSYADLGKNKKAIEDYNKAILIIPDDAYIFLNRGRAYGRLGKYKQAIKDYSQAIHINPVFQKAYQARGLTYLVMDEDKLTCIDFRKNCELGDCEDLEFAIEVDSCPQESNVDGKNE